jgi:hypothetical protein
MTIEIAYMPCCVISNIIFLLIRAFTFEKMECRMVNLLVTEEHDFLQSRFPVIRFISNLLVPALITTIQLQLQE